MLSGDTPKSKEQKATLWEKNEYMERITDDVEVRGNAIMDEISEITMTKETDTENIGELKNVIERAVDELNGTQEDLTKAHKQWIST